MEIEQRNHLSILRKASEENDPVAQAMIRFITSRVLLDWLDRLATIRCPTLVISGAADEATPPEHMIFTWSAPWRICSRTSLRTSSAPSAIAMQ
jgi:pimeloyl-ACP methyl ester carboxylesterase